MILADIHITSLTESNIQLQRIIALMLAIFDAKFAHLHTRILFHSAPHFFLEMNFLRRWHMPLHIHAQLIIIDLIERIFDS